VHCAAFWCGGFLQRLFNLLLARRLAFLDHELFGNLAEFPALLPHLQGR
jgi:hypothetical protein